MDETVRSELVDITEKILETLDVVKIYLFGSYANGTPHKDSDFDIYVIIPSGSMRCIEAMQKIGKALFAIQKRPLDILVCEESNFDKKASLLTIERTVKEEGVILYDRKPIYAMA
jgi:predicted nucleotidyltransferase